ncbi:hypothetical protein [Brevibacillus laterosporus]|uniref:hypothetical protein n=1 Tax=Brevibacillus laterosporus TaxID=1465 RepID=UPI003D22AA4D
MVKEDFTKNWPDPANAISPAEAVAIYLKHQPLTLKYVESITKVPIPTWGEDLLSAV